MIKRTLIVIAVVAFLASVAPTFAVNPPDTTTYPPFAVYKWVDDFQVSDDEAIKVDGTAHVFWPFDYKWLEICRIPVKMKVGMFVRVIDCDDKKITLSQKDCKDADTVNKGDLDWPCYWGCVKVKIIANFKAQIRGKLEGFDSKVFPDSGNISYKMTPETIEPTVETEVEICVKAWKVKIEKMLHGVDDEAVTVGELSIQARPAV
jgi:hypothetical protein